MNCNKVFLLPPANEVWGKVIFSEACVKNSVYRGGAVPGQVHAPDQAGTTPPPPGPGRYPHPDQVPLPPGPGRYTPWTRYTPSDQLHPPGPGRYPPGPDRYPPPSEQCMLGDRATSGRYASYWNVFLSNRDFNPKFYLLTKLGTQNLFLKNQQLPSPHYTDILITLTNHALLVHDPIT